MQILKWSEDFLIGHEELDSQHKDLFIIMDSLYHSIFAGKNNECEILINLFDYIANHFSYEEELFQKHNYPKAEEHIKNHRTFIKELNNRFANLCPVRGEDNSGLGYLLKELYDWIHNHMLIEDKEFAEYITTEG